MQTTLGKRFPDMKKSAFPIQMVLLLNLLWLVIGTKVWANTQPDFNQHWRFQLGECDDCASPSADDSKWQSINLPHDWSIKDRYQATDANGKVHPSPFTPDAVNAYDTGYTTGGTGWYRKHLKLNQPRQTALLYFDGVYMDASVYVNGHKVGEHYNGYTPFYLDISQQLNFNGENLIAVKVHNPDKNSRWYSGSGIYRLAELHFLPPQHIGFYGPHVTTPNVSATKASVAIATPLTLSATDNQQLTLTSSILNSEGKQVGNSITTEVVAQGSETEVTQQIILSQPQLWSDRAPYLYQLKQELHQGETLLQSRRTSFGIRSLEFSAEHGFLLNGQPTLLKGMNIHHDNYLLGAEAHPKAEWRKVERIKQAGYNAIRLSHNPPSKALLEAADALGMLVIDEAFDAWHEHKWDNVNDYAARFAQDWQQDLSAMILRDRNHPSVIMWSMGNEIPEQYKPLGSETARMLVEYGKTLDNSRPFTSGANISGESGDAYLTQFDVVGYNYQEHNYLNDHQRFPRRVMYGSETYSNTAFDYWQFVLEQPFIIGDFVWTGWDYIGEASIGWTGYAPEWKGLAAYPWNLAYSGEIDVLGNLRPSAYYRQVIWQAPAANTQIFVQSPLDSLSPTPNPDWYRMWVQPDLHPNWTWPGYAGAPLKVVVYSPCEQVELLLNGQSLGKQTVGKDNRYQVSYNVPYQQGELKAVGTHADGKQCDSASLNTSGVPASVQISAESNTLQADGQDLLYLNLQLLDANGNPVYWWQYDQEITVSVSGAAELYAIGNGDPRSVESFAGPSRNTFRGKASAVLRSIKGQAGEVVVDVSGPAIKHTQLRLNSNLRE